jgi:hypothetical protein
MYCSWDNSSQTSAEILSLKQWPIYRYQSCDLGCHTKRLIPVNTQTSSDGLIAHLRAGENPCNLQLNAAGFIWSITNLLIASDSILTSHWQYNPQDFPLHFVINFLFSSAAANDGYTTTSARPEHIEIQPIARRFFQYSSHRRTGRTQTTVGPPLRC